MSWEVINQLTSMFLFVCFGGDMGCAKLAFDFRLTLGGFLKDVYLEFYSISKIQCEIGVPFVLFYKFPAWK